MNELKDFFKLMAEGKKNTPTARAKKIEEQVRENVKSDFSTLLSELSSLKKQKQELVEQNPELLEHHEEISEEVITEVAPLSTPIGHVPPEQQLEPESNPALDMDEIGKYLSASAPKEGDNPLSEYAIINKKIKFLEQWVGKIQNTGPGSGEVNFRYLDDVNRGTMNPGNDNWVLEYDSATKKVQFTENVGPIRAVGFKTTGPLRPITAGELAWNPNEDCLDVQHEDGSKLQAGLETHMRVYNNGATTLTAGTFVGFAGAIEIDGDELPIAAPYTATVTANPLYIIGVLTVDVAPNSIGRATLYGKVRGLDTTGDSGLGETWNVGDLLWSHPTMAGRLTKVQPTAPYPAISVAAVMRKSSTTGVLLVRPSIFPRLWSGDWYSTENQSMTTINTPKRISVNNTGVAVGFTNNAGLITALHTGQYNFQFSLQITSSNSAVAYYYIWYRKNGQDVPHSATKLSISSNSFVLAPSWNFPVSMQANDTFELMWACDSKTVSLSALPETAFCPSIPSVILTVQQMNL